MASSVTADMAINLASPSVPVSAAASSRIFVKGLPPTITEDEFKKHFGAKHDITDAKLMQDRRIGYIGFKTPEDAAKAVKYFNKTYIRMSKIGVEFARPQSDATLPVSRKQKREQDRDDVKTSRKAKLEAAAAAKEHTVGQKRKRGEIDESDPKLKEFLDVMQPASKAKVWGPQDEEPPTKIQAIELPEVESDGEYEVVPKKQKKDSPKIPLIPALSPVPAELEAPTPADVVMENAVVPEATDDDDWLRSRTNRLLDLMDPADLALAQVENGDKESTTQAPVIPDAQSESKVPRAEDANDEDVVDQDNTDEDDKPDPVVEAIKATGRLFVRNLPYTASEDDIREHFAPYGALDEVHLPLDSAGKSKAMAFIQFAKPDAAAEAFHNLDGEPFQGRLIHIIPAEGKRENTLDEFAIAKLPLKKQREIRKKAEASSATFRWNSLFMSQDAVNSTIASRLGVSKMDLLDPTSADSGVKQAIAETSVIQEAKTYFTKNGVDVNAFKQRERGDTAILVKNFPFGTTIDELRKMFEEFGPVLRVLMPPAGTIAIVEMSQPGHAKAAFKLAYARFKDSILYLEKAPKNLFTAPSGVAGVESPAGKGGKSVEKLTTSDLLERETAPETSDTTTLFVKNLNFTTTSQRLKETFQPMAGFVSARVNTKTDPKKPGQVLSMGYGFLEFKNKEQAQAASKAMDGVLLDGHKLVIKTSHKGLDAVEQQKKDDRAKKLSGKRTKIIIKNLPFEATKKDIRALFSAYGQLRSVRVPQKFDHSARGFAFADFVTAKEAENALEALKDTHLLGRRLVLEFAAADAVDAEEEIERMQKKIGSQVNKVALEKLTGRGRKKFNIEGDDGEED